MKIRNGWVSNSSSSSFVCEVCGESASVYDGCTLESNGYGECEVGHMFCLSHQVEPSEKVTALIVARNKKEFLEEDFPSWQYTGASEEEMKVFKEEWKKEHLLEAEDPKIVAKAIAVSREENGEGSIPSERCPICSLHCINDDVMSEYLLHIFAVDRKSIEKQIREKFDDMKDLVVSMK